MRILILANNDGGLYKFRKELITELLNRGHEVYISLPNGTYIQPLVNMGCTFVDTPVDRRGVNPVKDIQLFKNYRRIIRKINPNLIITYTIKPNIYGGIASLLAKKRYAVNITGLGTAFEKPGLVRTIVVNLYRFALKRAGVVFFENSANRDTFLSYKCCSSDVTQVLNGAGVNTDEFDYIPYPNNDKFRFLFIGRVMKEKGIEELFEAMRRLNIEIPCFLDVVGPFEENYKEELNKYSDEGWLTYHGYQKNVRPFIGSCDCFVLPSYHEGMANTNLECASSGRPIITSNIPGCKESVIEESGLLCEPKNVDSLYSAMKAILDMPREKRLEMGKNGRIHMINNFDKNKVVTETISKLHIIEGNDY